MDCIKLNFRETGLFSKLIVDYVEGNPPLESFYTHPPSLQGYKKAIEDKSLSPEFRSTLVEVLKEQYANIDAPTKVISNIEALTNAKTFTVTTGHQLNIFTGPLFYIYKLVATINLAKELKKAYPTYNFVPVYWMGSEDHDYEEINHLYLNNKKYEWQTDQRGATGRFNTKGLEELLETLPGRTEIFKQALKRNKNLAGLVRDYVNAMFGVQGLICLDADDTRFKKEFLPVIKEELFKEISHSLVDEQSKKLDNAGYKQQLQPREINLFYMVEGVRARIVKKDDLYTVVDTELHFSKAEITTLLESNPERFSPNVILRPLYQETILPNIAYVGGPSELAYWFQLKSIFDHFKVPFPILMPRSFVMFINNVTSAKIKKLKVHVIDLFLRKDLLINKYIKTQSKGKLNMEDAKEQLRVLFASLKEKASAVDPTLGELVESEQVKGAKLISKVEQKMRKAEKRNRADELRILEEIYSSLYPSGVPHERRENILSIDNPAFIEQLLGQLNPLDLQYIIIKADK